MKGSRVGALLLLGGGACLAEATTFDVAFMTDPVGPKALPLLVGAILVFAGAHSFVRPPPAGGWPPPASLKRIGAAALAFALYAGALPLAGFFLSTTVVLTVLAGLFGAGPRRGAPAAALLTAALWMIFVRGLGLPLPVGELWMR